MKAQVSRDKKAIKSSEKAPKKLVITSKKSQNSLIIRIQARSEDLRRLDSNSGVLGSEGSQVTRSGRTTVLPQRFKDK